MTSRRVPLLLLASFCFYLIGIANDRLSMHVLCWMTCSLVLVSWVLTRVGVQGLRLRREPLPPRLAAGTPLPGALAVVNDGSLAKDNLLLLDPIVNETQRQTSLRRVLLSRLGGGTALPVAPPAALAERGRVLCGPVSVQVSDPIGLFRRTLTSPETMATTLVHPRTVALPRFGRQRVGAGWGVSNRHRRDGYDLRAIREYEPGDDLRHVDWPATAHTGQLQIREYEQAATDRALVVVDLCTPPNGVDPSRRCFETVLSATASILLRLVGLGYPTTLLGDEDDRLVLGSGGRGVDEMLDRLAIARGEGWVSLAALLDRETDLASRASVVVAVSAAPDSADALPRLRRGRTSGALLVSVGEQNRRPSPSVLTVSPDDDLSEALSWQEVG